MTSVTRHKQRDGVRRFDVTPISRARPTLEDLPRLEESLRARVIVDRPYSVRMEAKRARALSNTPVPQKACARTRTVLNEGDILSILTLNLNGLRVRSLKSLF